MLRIRSQAPQRGARRQPGLERSGTLGYSTPQHLAPTGRKVTTSTLFRVAGKGPGAGVGRGPPGGAPGVDPVAPRGPGGGRV